MAGIYNASVRNPISSKFFITASAFDLPRIFIYTVLTCTVVPDNAKIFFPLSYGI